MERVPAREGPRPELFSAGPPATLQSWREVTDPNRVSEPPPTQRQRTGLLRGLSPKDYCKDLVGTASSSNTPPGPPRAVLTCGFCRGGT